MNLVKVEGTLLSISFRPLYPVLGFLVSIDGEENTAYIKPPEHTYGAIQCDGKQIATTHELFEWVTVDGGQIHTVMNFDVDKFDQKLATSILLTRGEK